MEAIGSEVGQKMRSAIKAKLMELGCYVDDELPDYVMVMVANKRTRSQMEEDLQLFLANNTEAFVSWLHQVLQKLQEVTINTNFAAVAEPLKQGKHINSDLNVKKERKEKDKKKDKEKSKGKTKPKLKKSKKEKNRKESKEMERIRPNVPPLLMNLEKESSPSITDIFAGQILKSHGIKSNNLSTTPLVEPAITVNNQSSINESHCRRRLLNRNRFPIIDPEGVSQLVTPPQSSPPLDATISLNISSLSEKQSNPADSVTVQDKAEKIKEMDEINAKIITLKKKLAVQLESGSEDEDFINLRTEAEELMGTPFTEETNEKACTPPPVSGPNLPNLAIIELNLPKRPLRERLGVPTPVVQCVSPYQPSTPAADRNDNKSQSDKPVIPKPAEEPSEKVSIKSRLTLREENVEHRKIQSETSSSFNKSSNRPGKESSTIRKRIGSRVVAASAPSQSEGRSAVASVVRAPPRPVRGAAAAPSLLLRAVADAHRSLLSMPPKLEVDSSMKKKARVLPMRRKVDPKKIIIEVSSDKIPSPSMDSRNFDFDIDINIDMESLEELQAPRANEYVPEPRGHFRSVDYVPTHIGQSKGTKSVTEKSLLFINAVKEMSETSKDPQFVVTLDGLDPNIFLEKKLVSENSDGESENKSENKIKNDNKNGTDEEDALSENETETICKTDDEISRPLKDSPVGEKATRDTQKEDRKIEIKLITVKKETIEKHLTASARTPPSEETCVSPGIEKEAPPPRKRKASPIIFNKIESKTSKTMTKEKKVVKDDSVNKYDNLPSLGNEKRGRCRYFPMCRLGPECEFAHPQMCRAFPQCPFGRACAYAHPVCRFGPQCTRRDCSYSHPPTPPPAPLVASRVVAAANYKSISSGPTVCRFFPDCSKVGCPFLHPRPCHFGAACLNRAECNFYHPGGSSALRWAVPRASPH